MTVLIIIFGALTLLAGIVIVINPEVIFGFLRNNLDKLVLHILAVVVRLVIGVLLIYQWLALYCCRYISSCNGAPQFQSVNVVGFVFIKAFWSCWRCLSSGIWRISYLRFRLVE
jgi:hypothetical protein